MDSRFSCKHFSVCLLALPIGEVTGSIVNSFYFIYLCFFTTRVVYCHSSPCRRDEFYQDLP